MIVNGVVDAVGDVDELVYTPQTSVSARPPDPG
jgi:hypothetical protein